MKRSFIIAILMMSSPLAAYSIVPTLFPGSLQGTHLIPLIGGPSVSVPYYLEMSQIEAFVLANTTLPSNVSCSSGYYVSSYLASTGSFTCSAGGSGSGLPYTISSGRAITGYSITFQNVSSAIYNNPMSVPTGAVSSNSTTAFPTDAQVLAFVSYSCPAGTGPHKNTALDGGTVCTTLPSGGSSGSSSNTSWGLVPTQVTSNQTIQVANAYKIYNKRILTFRNHSSLGTITVFNNATGNTKCIPDSAATKTVYASFSGYSTGHGYSFNIPGMTYAQFKIWNDGVITAEFATNPLTKTGINEYSVVNYPSDNFQRDDQLTLVNGDNTSMTPSGTWAGIHGVQLLSNYVTAHDGSGNYSVSYWTNLVVSAIPMGQQCSSITVGTLGSGQYTPMVRIQTSGGTINPGYAIETGEGIEVLDSSGNFVALSSGGTISGTDTVGEVLKLCANGSTLTAYRNGTLIGTGTDTTYATGYVGIGTRYNDTAITYWSGSIN